MPEGSRRKAARPAGKPAAAAPSDSAAGPAPAAKAPSRAAKGAERRQHPRVAATLPFRILNEGGRQESFDLVDLSECGARIACHHAIPAMTRIQVALVLPGKRLRLTKDVRVDTTGVVVWSHRGADGNYDTGVFFPDLDVEQRGLLRALVIASS